METKHTPGPWEIIQHSWSDTSIVSGDKTICSISIYGEATEETQEALEEEASANARLIAAAPEMLDMLKDISDTLEAGDTPHVYQINELIKKATEQ